MTQTILQPNMLVYPTPVLTEAHVTKSRPDLNAIVHQAGRDPLVLKVRKSFETFLSDFSPWHDLLCLET